MLNRYAELTRPGGPVGQSESKVYHISDEEKDTAAEKQTEAKFLVNQSRFSRG